MKINSSFVEHLTFFAIEVYPMIEINNEYI